MNLPRRCQNPTRWTSRKDFLASCTCWNWLCVASCVEKLRSIQWLFQECVLFSRHGGEWVSLKVLSPGPVRSSQAYAARRRDWWAGLLRRGERSEFYQPLWSRGSDDTSAGLNWPALTPLLAKISPSVQYNSSQIFQCLLLLIKMLHKSRVPLFYPVFWVSGMVIPKSPILFKTLAQLCHCDLETHWSVSWWMLACWPADGLGKS